MCIISHPDVCLFHRTMMVIEIYDLGNSITNDGRVQLHRERTGVRLPKQYFLNRGWVV